MNISYYKLTYFYTNIIINQIPERKKENRNTRYRGNRKLFTSGCTKSPIKNIGPPIHVECPNEQNMINQAMYTKFPSLS